MTNINDSKQWLKEAENCLLSAKDNIEKKHFKVVIQFSQLCIEQSIKAIVSIFNEPLWSHEPGEQLKNIVKKHEVDLNKKFSKEFLDKVIKLSDISAEYFQWHTWSLYGKRDKEGNWLLPSLICTEEKSEEILKKSEYSLSVAKEFTGKWENNG